MVGCYSICTLSTRQCYVANGFIICDADQPPDNPVWLLGHQDIGDHVDLFRAHHQTGEPGSRFRPGQR